MLRCWESTDDGRVGIRVLGRVRGQMIRESKTVGDSILEKVSKENQNTRNKRKRKRDGPIAWSLGLSNTTGNVTEHV